MSTTAVSKSHPWCQSSLWLALWLALVTLFGCSDATDENPSDATAMEVSELLQGGIEGEATVRGFVVWSDASARLCEVLLESFPAQCGGPWIAIANPELLDVSFDATGGVQWTPGYVEVEGFYDGNRLVLNADGSG